MDKGRKDIIAREDQREALRQPTGTHIVLLEHSGVGAKEAVLVNISRTGILLTTTHSFPEGSTVTVHPPEGFTDLQPQCMRIQRRQEHMRADERWFEYGLTYVDAEDCHKHAWYLNLRLSG